MRQVLFAAISTAISATAPQLPFLTPACDLSRTPAEYCEDYCTGRCSLYNTSNGDTGRPRNLTLYRLTPRGVLGLENHNTGDVPGDVGFILSNRRKILECLQNETSRGCFLDNATDNIYGRFEVEIDGQYGPYFQCNPLYQNASNPFECYQKCETPPDCHNESGYDAWVNGTSGWAGATCYCETCPRCHKTVGRAYNPYTWHGHVPVGWPRQCYSFDPVVDAAGSGQCLEGKIWKSVSGMQSIAATLEAVCDLCDYDSPCEGFTVQAVTTHGNSSSTGSKGRNATAAATTATTFSARIFTTKVDALNRSAHAPAKGKGTTTACVSGLWGDHWGGSVGVPIGGQWYSTPAEGKCPPGAALGSHGGCTWRYQEDGESRGVDKKTTTTTKKAPGKYYGSACVDARVDKAVETHGAPCFAACPQPANKTSLCYSECYAATLEGDPIHNISAMSPEQVTQPWADAFLPVAQGGCPEIEV